ncbi:MAG: cell division protein FtsZ [Bryobacterales bacterium]|nr:cell division protein FtsZ [Bryobacterales bacterium]
MELMVSDSLKYELEEEASRGARIKVIGVGGGGSNAVTRMLDEGLVGVEFHIINTDAQALASSRVPNKLQIGKRITAGLGVGADPALGKQAALEDTDAILEMLHGADMVFVAAGLGGGTGTGAAPVVAALAKQIDALTIAVVTKPFSFEGPRRMRAANQGLAELAATVDTVIAIPNDRLLALVPRGASLLESFKVADDILRQSVQGMSDIMSTPGIINRDFSDIKAAMQGMGYAMMGTAIGRGENAATDAARQAIECPLFEDSRIAGSRGVLINITGSSQLGLHEVNEACAIIRQAADCDEVQINFGVSLDESMGDAVKVTVIATGFQPGDSPAVMRRAPVSEWEAIPVEQPVYEEAAAAPQPEIITSAFDSDDLDTPAYLRQGKMLN